MDEQESQEISVAELLDIARTKTRKLIARERRQVIEYIDEAGYKDSAGQDAELTNYELADLFGVDEKIIRMDKRKIMREYTGLITPQESMVFVGSFLKAHDDLIRRAVKGLSASPLGTLAHQNYLKIISDLLKRRITILQEIGAIPKELGNLNVTHEEWQAYVTDDGQGNATSGVRRIALPEPADVETFEADLIEDQ